MTPQLQIRLLGDFGLRYEDQLVTEVDTPRLQSLLAYLVLHRDAAQSRAQLSYLFWLDSTEAQARTNLRKQIYLLRRALPNADRFLYIDHKVLHWRSDAPFSLDVAEFETAIDEADRAEARQDGAAQQHWLEEAIRRYGGDLLPTCYEDWVLAERERLRQRYTRALERLIAWLESQREYSLAIQYAQRLLRDDPLHEATHRGLMRLQALNGNRAAALRAYHTCATLLERELNVEPSAATQAVYERLLELDAVRAPPVERPAPATSLIGRDREWTQLQRAWRSAADGRPRLVLIRGEAGIGKTRLAEELLIWTRRQGILTARTRGYASEEELAYGLVADWLRAPTFESALFSLDDIWLSEIARLLPELQVERPEIQSPGPLTEDWQRQRFFQALARPFFEHRQLLLLMDDMQWGDPETLQWLPYLLHRRHTTDRASGQATQLLLIATMRTSLSGNRRLNALLEELRRSGRLTEIELGPLSEAETLSLAADAAGQDLDPSLAALLYRGSEGNPLFVVEMVRAGQGRDGQWMAQHGAERAGVDLPLPPKVQRVIEARLSQLSPPARELAGVASTIGRAFTFDVLARVHGANEETLVLALDELWRRRIVREQGAAAYDFGHDRIREVAYTGLSSTRRQFLHRRVAQALSLIHTADLAPVHGQIGRQYEAASEMELAIHHYIQAAAFAQRLYANDEAISHLTRAIALLPECDPSSEPQSPQVYEQMADLLALGGKGDEARQAYRQALGCLGPEETVRQAGLWRKVASSWSMQYQYEPAQTNLEKALQLLGPEPISPTPAWWQTWLDIQFARLSLFYFQARLPEMEDLSRRMRPLVEEHATARQKVSFLQRQAMLEFRQLRYVPSPQTLNDGQVALKWAQSTQDMPMILYAEFALAFTLLWSGETQAAIDQFETTLPRTAEVGDLPTQTLCLTYLSVAHRLQGDLEQCKHYTDRCLEKARDGGRTVYIGAAEANLSWLAYRAGALEAAVRHGKAALAEWQPSQYPFHWLARWPLLAVALDQGRIADAVEQARAMLDPLQQRLPDALTSSLEEALAAWNGGRAAAAHEHLIEAVGLAQDKGYL